MPTTFVTVLKMNPEEWRRWLETGILADKDVEKALEILREKFGTENSYGPMQVSDFHNFPDQTDREIEARRAFELVKKFISLVEG